MKLIPWEDADETLRSISQNGGDEDFIAILSPKEFEDYRNVHVIEGISCCCDWYEVTLSTFGFPHVFSVKEIFTCEIEAQRKGEQETRTIPYCPHIFDLVTSYVAILSHG